MRSEEVTAKDNLAPPPLSVLADLYELEAAATQADVLSPVSAEIFEEALKHNQLDLVNRARLLGFYHRSYWKRTTPQMRKYRERRTEHILWFIENAATCKFAGNVYFALDKRSDSANYAEVSSAWQRAMRQSVDIQIAINAALFFYKHEPHICRDLLQTVFKEDASNAWASAIFQIMEPTKLLDVDASGLASSVSAATSTFPEDNFFKQFVERAFQCGQDVSAVSLETLNRVLNEHTNDCAARAELLGYYGHCCARANILGCDPHFEREFAFHFLWFIKNVPWCAARFRPPENLSPNIKSLLLTAWETYGGKFENPREGFPVLSEKLRPRVPNKAEERQMAINARGFPGFLNYPGALDRVAVKPHRIFISKINPKSKVTIVEWANECFMSGTGPSTIHGLDWVDHLDHQISECSIDLRNRARIIEFSISRSVIKELGDQDKVRIGELRAKHLMWLIDHAPGCDFLRYLDWKWINSDPHKLAIIEAFQLATKVYDDVDVYINAAIMHAGVHPEQSISLLASALSLAPGNQLAEKLLAKLQGRSSTPSPQQLLNKHHFVSSSKSKDLTFCSTRLGYRNALRRSPARTAWSSEQVLQNNPNDVELRLELLFLYDRKKKIECLGSVDPEHSDAYLRDALWILQNVPESLGSEIGSFERKDPDVQCAIVAAWEQQVEAYPKSAAVVANASPVLPREAAIKLVDRALKMHPGNYILQQARRSLDW